MAYPLELGSILRIEYNSRSFYIFQLSDFTEVRASTAQQCASYFDTAVTRRTSQDTNSDDGDSNPDDADDVGSTTIFTLHVYQYMVDKVGTGESKCAVLYSSSVKNSNNLIPSD